MTTLPTYLTDEKVAEIFNISVNTLRKQRSRGIGFPVHRIGHLVRYRLDECERHAATAKAGQ